MKHMDKVFMREARRLAARGKGRVEPNPMVGAAIVKNGKVITRGWHRRYGASHAEVEALKRAGKRAKGATLFVTLEPCAHWGKTPPCADAVLRAGVSRVVIAARDPNGLARGGVEALRRASTKVSVGILEKEARALNASFYTFHMMKRPFVSLKFAASLDGKLGTRTGESKWLTSEAARRYARRLRGEHTAVLVGVETVLADDPRLTSRTYGLREPLRIVLDSRLRIPLKAHILNERLRKSFMRNPGILIATTSRASARKRKALEARGVHTLVCGKTRVSISQLLRELYKMNIQSVLVEGGGSVLGSFLDAGVADKVYAFYGSLLIGGTDAPSIGGRGMRSLVDALRLRAFTIKRFGDSVLILGSR